MVCSFLLILVALLTLFISDTSEDNFLSEKGSQDSEQDNSTWTDKEIMERYFELTSRQNEWDDPDEPGFVRVMVSREQYYRETSGQSKPPVCKFYKIYLFSVKFLLGRRWC